MLVFDREQYEITKLYVLTTPEKNRFFVFENALEAKDFIERYYRHPVLALMRYDIELAQKEKAG